MKVNTDVNSNKKSESSIAEKIAAVVFWLGVWVAAYYIVDSDVLLSSPWQVLSQFKIIFTEKFWATVGMTLFRTLLAYISGVAIAFTLSVLSCTNRWCKAIISPAMRAIRATPVASFIILALVWFSSGNVPILAGILMVMPIVYSSTVEGIESTDKKLLEFASIYRFSAFRVWGNIIIPSVIPTVLASCQACVGICFKATIAAEVIGIPINAIGTQIHNSKIYLETDQLMAWTVVVILLSLIIEKLLKTLCERLIIYANHH